MRSGNDYRERAMSPSKVADARRATATGGGSPNPTPRGDGKQPIYSAQGFRAQYIFVVPEHDMVVVVTGGTRSSTDQRKPLEFLYSHILPAVIRGDQSSPPATPARRGSVLAPSRPVSGSRQACW